MNSHDTRGEGTVRLILKVPWRVGRKVGRNIYALTNDDGVIIGQVDSSQIAEHIVILHNQALDQLRLDQWRVSE